MKTIALFGAAGSMGTRASNALRNDPAYRVLHIESGPGVQKLRDRGLTPMSKEDACPQADVVLLTVPDEVIGPVAHQVVPLVKPGTLLICLDAAAPYAGRLPKHGDVAFFVTHPAHPPVFNDEQAMDARRDFFGSGLAKQAIVSALMQGTEDDYRLGEEISRKMFGPILRSHRMTVEQMAVLEPALSESVAATCLSAIREGLDEAVARGVPPQAARDFLMGHLNVELAILFNEIDWKFSAGCRQAIDEAKPVLFRPDWKRVFDPAELAASCRRITGG
ncbi:MAG: semialdehyde dehydrogenase [Isosphaera sp.]|nr:semialdehyde dehydrogenase [Isosphaera sp.]